MTPAAIKTLIEKGIDGAEAIVEGDGTHFVACVISDAFAGLSMVRQHQRVYAALGDSFKDAIHALSLQTYTRAEWERAAKFQVL